MALTRAQVQTVIDTHRTISALSRQIEEIYKGPGTYDADVNEALIMLYHSMKATKWVSHNASRTMQQAYAPGWEDCTDREESYDDATQVS